MLHSLFVVFDVKSSVYCPPLPFRHKGDAIRWFTERANDKNNNIGKYPNDFILYEIGTFDDVACVLNMEVLKPLGIASEFVS